MALSKRAVTVTGIFSAAVQSFLSYIFLSLQIVTVLSAAVNGNYKCRVFGK